jgi:hypothetical protein
MTDRLAIGKNICLLTLTALLTFSSTLCGEEPKDDDAAFRQYWADATLFSMQPNVELATYRSYGGGGAGPGGTLGMGVADKQRRFQVSVAGKLKAHRFVATVSVTPDQEDTRTPTQSIEYDLSDINPRALEIARDEDGRVYRLNLTPRIIVRPRPKEFKVSELRLENWSFPASPVILNDQDYIGQLGMSYGTLAWCDIPGLAKIEFSLLHLKGASPFGTLKDGVINIAHENGTTLTISNVKNGIDREVLNGGPYQVWVRWSKSTESVEEYHKSLKAQIAMLKERVKNGETLRPGSLERLEKMSESDRIGLMSNGLSQIEPDDLVDPDE